MAKWLYAVLVMAVFGAVPSTAIAAADEPTTLQQFFAKRFKTGRGLFGALASAIPVKLDPNSIAGMEGIKPDGSYWTSVFFNSGNIRMFDDPRNALSKFCAGSGGGLKIIRPYALGPKQGLGFFSTKLQDANGAYLVPEEIPGRWAMSPPDGAFAGQRDPYVGNTSAIAVRIDERGALGLFSCVDGAGVPVWHVAILPTVAGAWNSIGDWSGSNGDRSVMLSVREVNRTLVDRVETAVKSRWQAERAATDAKAQKEAAGRTDANARAAQAIPRLRAFQSAVKVGDETSCGLVLAINGPLVEVQVPSDVKLDNGATRLFVKRTMLSPVRSDTPCYVYNPADRTSLLAANPIEELGQ